MTGRRPADEMCPVAPWCDQGAAPHDRHLVYIGSLVAHDFTGKALTVQVVAENAEPERPKAALILVDSRDLRMAAELSWDQARRVGGLLIEGARRYA